jgi:sucrose-phosphate synthase
MRQPGLYILMLSVHGLIRGREPELGRDPDTGGQVLYVLELSRELARQPEVAQVDLLTRLVEDPAVAGDYAEPEEPLSPKARILRLPFGPRRYIRKELLWDHLDDLVTSFLAFARNLPRLPDLIHSHYADAGYVAARLSGLLGIPFVHCAHSLGRIKQESLLLAGQAESDLERQFHFSRRIRAEEDVLQRASLVVASTQQEFQEQYGRYRRFDPRRAVVIAPGTDLARFAPPRRREPLPPVAAMVDRFLRDPGLPMLLCVGRPEPRKNLLGLVRAFGEAPELRRRANLVLLAGSRGNIGELAESSRNTWMELLLAQDRYDLYGHLAIPKVHEHEDVPGLYRLAVQRRGLCVNPAHSETFGLTLIEAAASGLPVVATDRGGPRDILRNCRNGLLIDTREPAAIAAGLLAALSDPGRWDSWSANGPQGVREFYTWSAHARRYLQAVDGVLRRWPAVARRGTRTAFAAIPCVGAAIAGLARAGALARAGTAASAPRRVAAVQGR